MGWCGGGIWSAQDKHIGRVVAEGYAVFLEGQDDAAAEFAENDVALVGVDAELDGVGNGAAFDLVYAEYDWVGDGDVLEVGLVANLVGHVVRMAMTLSGLALASTLTLRVATA